MKKTWLALLCALGILCGGADALAQEDLYEMTVLPYAKSGHEQVGSDGLAAHADGTLDYLINNTAERNDVATAWFHSPDGGKTWVEADMGWYEPAKKANFRQEKVGAVLDGKFYDLYQGADGAYYTLMDTHGYEETKGNSNYARTDSQVFRIKDGQAQPMLTLKASDNLQLYRILRVEENGDIALFEGRPVTRGFRGVRVYDGKTGQIKKELAAPSQGNEEISYANGIVYQIAKAGKRGSLTGTDINTGKQTVSIPLPEADYQDGSSVLCTQTDGTVFLACPAGLYRLKPGESKLVKLAGADAGQFGKDCVIWEAVCTEDGTVYLTMAAPTHANQYKLYRYSPK